jgi:hypothetical protein
MGEFPGSLQLIDEFCFCFTQGLKTHEDGIQERFLNRLQQPADSIRFPDDVNSLMVVPVFY